MSEAVLNLSGIAKTYDAGKPSQVDMLRGVDLSVSTGEVVALVAPSGAGKSTLLHIAGLLDTPDEGTVALVGHNLTGQSDRQPTLARRSAIAFTYLFHPLLPEFSAYENVAMPALIAGQAIDHRHILALGRDLVCAVGQAQPTQIADILTQGQAAVHAGFALIQRTKRIVLRNQSAGQRIEVCPIFIRPPIAQNAIPVRARTLIIKTVSDLMTDNAANRAIIDRWVGGQIEERRLQNGRWEDNLVSVGTVISVDGLREHEPFGAVDWATKLRDLILPTPLRHSQLVF